MLQEVLLVLAGFKSELICETPGIITSRHLHPSEQTQLLQIARFGELHREVANRVKFIRSSYWKNGAGETYEFTQRVFTGPYSSVSHAICGILDRLLLRVFRETLINIEKQVLDRDSLYVGGDNVVSLSLVTSKTIREYERRFLYAKSLLLFIMGDEENQPVRSPASHEIMNKLINDNITGYKDIQALTTALLVEVQSNWLRLLRSWIIYGRLPVNSEKEQLLIRYNRIGDEYYVKDIPDCVNEEIAQDILIIGSCLNKMDILGRGTQDNKILLHKYEKTIESNIKLLTSVEFPISLSQFGQIVKAIRVAVYRDIVTNILPAKDMLQLFMTLRKIALCGSSDFVRMLCELAENRADNVISNPNHANEIFANALLTTFEDITVPDWEVDLAHKIFKYTAISDSRQRSSLNRFDDFLFGIRCGLQIDLYWPFNILMSKQDIAYYNVIFSFVSALYMARAKLEGIWRSGRSDRADRSKIMANRIKVFLDILCEYLQDLVTDKQFGVLKKVIEDQAAKHEIDPDVIISSHRQYLENIVHAMCIEDEELRIQLKKLFKGSITLSETVGNGVQDLERDLVATMERVSKIYESCHRISPEMSLLLLKFGMVSRTNEDGLTL